MPVSSPVIRENQLTLSQLIERTVDPAPVLIVRELTGPEQRQVALGNRALPFQGSLKFVGRMRTDKTSYVGFPISNQTVLGAVEDDTEMNGEWHDRFISDPDQVSAVVRRAVNTDAPGEVALARSELRTARDLCDLFDDIRVQGRQLRVTWAHISRLGRLIEFEQNWMNLHDVKWRMRFEWTGRDDLTADRPSPARTSLVGVARELSSRYVDVHDATNFDGIENLRPSFADRVDSAVGVAQRTIEELGNAVETRLSASTTAIDSVRRAVTLASTVRDQAQDIVDALNATTASAMMTVTVVDLTRVTLEQLASEPESLQSLVTIDPGSAIAAACQQLGAIRAARALKHAAARQRFQALRAIESEVIAVVVMRGNEDLRDVAERFYGSPSEWEQIRSFNAFESSSVPVGTFVLVPRPRTI